MKVKTLIGAVGAAAVLAGTAAWNGAPAGATEVTVYKSPTCGCCNAWIDHLEEHGFEVKPHNVEDITAVKRQYGIAGPLSSCHTAVVDGYLIEGHVPADDIKRLLRETPEVAGLAVPGMPMGSPGMEGPYKQPYQVLTFDHEGNTSVYAER